MLAVSLVAATVMGMLGAGAAYLMGFGIVGIILAYALAGQTAFAVVIALIAADPAQDHPDFQKQIELDLLALKEEIMRDQAAGKRVNVFRQEQIAQKPRTRRVPRPIIPTV